MVSKINSGYINPDNTSLVSEIKKFLETADWLTPLNLQEERHKVLTGKTQNPHFIYQAVDSNKLKQYLQKLESLKLGSGTEVENYFIRRKAEELSLKVKLILNRGKSVITEISSKLYGLTFNDDIVRSAEIDSRINESFGGKDSISAIETVVQIKNYLASYNITGWKVSVSGLEDFYVRVRSSQKEILVNKEINWDFCDLDNLLAHEVDGHVLRSINSINQTDELFRKPFPFYIKTEEGLASYLADYYSSTALISRKHHALKYLGGKVALTSTFYEVYKYLIDFGFTADLAFQRTFRLKRGFEDTSVPGCFAREAIYYEGLIEVKKYLDNGGDVKKLFSCKSSLEDLDKVPIAKNTILPNRLDKKIRFSLS